MLHLFKKTACLCLLCFLLTGGFLPVFAMQKLNLNQATVEQLLEIKGIGQKTAENIISYRDLHGDFSSLDEITNVKGIGQKKLEVMRDYLTVKENSES